MSENTWCDLSENWCDTEELWSQCAPVIKKIKKRGRSSGAMTKQFGKLNSTEKKLLIKVILICKGVKYKDSHIIEDYKVTTEDLHMIVDEYDKRENIKVEVNDVNVVLSFNR